MNRGQHLWQGQKLLTYSDGELVEIARLLAALLTGQTGQRGLPDKVLSILPRRELFHQVERLDLALDAFRPLPHQAPPASPAPPPAASSSIKSGAGCRTAEPSSASGRKRASSGG